MSNSERKHALLSASGAKRWVTCTPSARLEDTFKNTTSVFAEEGTFMHELAELQINYYLERIDRAKFKQLFEGMKGNKYYSIDIYEAVQAYVGYACELIAEAHTRSSDAIALVEQRLDFSHYVAEAFGTGDLIIVSNGVLDVVDLKGGKGVRVSAEHNTQMMLYALGALNIFDLLYDIETVRMTICQPRLDSISTFELTVGDLKKWAETELKPRAELAFRGEGEFKSGEHCRFCRARSQCRTRANSNLELAMMDFKLPELLTDEEISEVLAQANELKSWAKDVWEYAEKEAMTGRKKWPGYKLIEGTSRRKYSDEAKIAEQVLATGDYDETQIYTKNLIGITAMTQLLGKQRFRELLGGLCIAPPGKPSLVVESDKHQEWNPLDAARSDFADAI